MDAGRGRSSTATVLFTDVVGSTELRREVGDDRADELRRRHDAAVRAAAAEHLGEIVKSTGDGLMIVFPAAAQAVAGSVSIQRAISRLSRTLATPLGVRVGVSAGDVEWEGDDCFGTPVVEAARLCSAAAERQILTSEIVRLLAGSRGGHRLASIGVLDLKGLGEMAAYEVCWDAGSEASVPLPLVLSASETLPLVGRSVERDALVTAWKRALDGSPQLALLAGEPGVGKTRLAAELARSVHGDGAVVLFGRCDEELGVPYQPFVEAVATYAAGCDDASLGPQLAAAGGDIARLVPSLATRFQLAEPLRADPETERYRLFESCTALLSSIGADAPVLLLVDDLHWAAQPTLLLLRHLVRHQGQARTMIVGTYRDTDLGRGHPLAEALADLRREAGVERVALRGLAEAEVLELVASAAGHDLDDATTRLAREVNAETEGNPFFIGQVLRHLVETGAVQVEDGRWVVSAHRPVGIPEGVREVIGKRLAQLRPDTNDVLSAAAVIGREFDASLLVDASGLDADAVLDGLEEAEAARLVVPLADRADRRTFAHALVRSTLYEEIPTTRRLRTHRQVMLALEARADRGVHCSEELAHHACEAAALGDVERALRWSRAAAQDAFEHVAYEEAARHHQRVLDVLDPQDPAQRAERTATRVLLARAQRAAGAMDEARAMALLAAEEARGAGRPDLLIDAALVIGSERGWSEAGVVNEQLIALLEEGLAALPAGDSSRRAMAMARLAGELYFVSDAADRRQDLTAEAVAMAERIADSDTSGFVLSCAAWGAWLPHNPHERRARALEILDLGERSGNLVTQTVGAMWLFGAQAELGDGEGLRSALALEQRLAEAIRQPEWTWTVAVHRAAVALMSARYDEAAELAEEALQIGQVLGSETVFQMYGIHLFALGRERGGLEQLVPMVQAMVEQYPLIPAWHCGLAYLYRELGMADEAQEVFEHFAADEFRSLPLDVNWKAGVAVLAAVCAMLDDAERARVLYEMLLPLADTTVTVGSPADILGSVHGPLTLLAGTLGRWDDAETHYEAAKAADERSGCLAWRIYDDFEWGRLLARRGQAGDAARARALLERCLADARDRGMTRVVTLSEELLTTLG